MAALTASRVDVYPKMNPGPKALLVAALRSGRFTQGRGALHRNDKGTVVNCCLGVLMLVAGEQGLPLSFRDGCDGVRWYTGRGGEVMGTPTSAVCDWAGIFVHPDTKASLVLRRLIDMNDRQGKTFNEIADWVEVNL